MKKPKHASTLNGSQKESVLYTLSKGGNLEMAARRAGCSHHTLWHVIDSDTKFRHRVDEARAEYELQLLDKLSAESPNQWRAAAWALERLFPDRYASRKPHSLSFTEFKANMDLTVELFCSELESREACQRIIEKSRKVCDEIYVKIGGVMEEMLDAKRQDERRREESRDISISIRGDSSGQNSFCDQGVNPEQKQNASGYLERSCGD